MDTIKLARIGLLIALSYLGSLVKIPTPVGTTAFDSAAAFLAGLLLGPGAGATVGLLGHLFTAFLTGFPYSVPIHLTIAVGMAVVVAVFSRLSAKRLTLGLITALLGNGIALPLVLAAWPMFTFSIVIGAIMPGVLLATALNLIVAAGVYRALGKRNGCQRDALITTYVGQRLVITADNSAGIGRAKLDRVQVDPYLVGLLTARVALLEAISLGAEPVAISSTLSFDHQSSDGQLIHQGIMATAATIGLGPEQITGSSETNFPAEITCLGVTVIGVATREQLLLDRGSPGDDCWLLGQPLVGAEVVTAQGGLLTLPMVKSLTGWPTVQEILPVGSRGVRWEVEQLAERYGLHWQAESLGENFPWQKSAGPATCLIVCGQPDPKRLAAYTGQTVTLLGYLQSR